MSETVEDVGERRVVEPSRSFDVFLTQQDGFEILEMEEFEEPDPRLTSSQFDSGDTECEPILEEGNNLPTLPTLPTAGSSNSDELGISTPVTTREPRRSHFVEDLQSALAHGPDDVIKPEISSQGVLQTRGGNGGEAGVCHELQSHVPGEQSALPNEKLKPLLTGHLADSKLAAELYTVSYLIFFSILGTLARLGLSALSFYPGAPVETGVLWANLSGSLIMGFLATDCKLFRTMAEPVPQKERGEDEEKFGSSASANLAAVKKKVPLYIGLATGFCGSFTSFSSFIRDAYLALSNALPVPVSHISTGFVDPSSTMHRNPGYSLMAVLAVVILTTSISLGSLQFGAHLALCLEPFTPSLHILFARKLFNRIMVFIAFGSWLGAIFMTVWPPDRTWTQETWRGKALFALIFAPLGCLFRFYFSLYLNPQLPSFPLGTFGVNMLGTALLSLFFDLQHSPLDHGIGCEILQGFMDGFCGCLTTVSTWVAELNALGKKRKGQAYIYGGVSVAVGLGLAVVIMGSLQWTQGFQRPACAR